MFKTKTVSCVKCGHRPISNSIKEVQEIYQLKEYTEHLCEKHFLEEFAPTYDWPRSPWCRKKNMKPHELLGDTARQLCWLFDGSIIGGFAKALYHNESTANKDIDIVIPLDKWIQASKIIPKRAVLNSFGGMKFSDNNFTMVDCWADDIARVAFYSNKEQYIYNPRFDTFLVTGNHAK